MAGRGPLPNPSARRRNAPTIPTTSLPASGRSEPAPKCPYELAAAGKRWWKWAWALPQAAAWDQGSLYAVARRAQLEDRLAALDFGDDLDFGDLFAEGDVEARRRVEWALSTLKRSASGSLQIEKEMRELDRRLGLDPKALAELRWTIVPDEEKPQQKAAPSRRHLRAVEA